MATGRHIFISKLHKWVGLLIAVQMLFWTVGGVVMSWIPIETVRGQINRSAVVSSPVKTEIISKILERYAGEDLVTMRVRNLAGIDAVELHFEAIEMQLISVADLSTVEITEELALKIARADFKGQVGDARIQFLTEEPGDYRRTLPVWQVEMGDNDGTRIYVHPMSGNVLSHRNNYWRFYDFFWMLHIMDYEDRDDFNNPLIMMAALTAALFSITGVCMIYYRFRKRDFGIKRKK